MDKITLLITGRSLKHKNVGGIVPPTRVLLKELDEEKFKAKYFSNGGGHKSLVTKIVRPFTFTVDLLRFLTVLVGFRPKLIHINTSLNWKSIIRDGTFLIMARALGIRVLLFIHGWQKEIGKQFLENRRIITIIFGQLFRMPTSIVVMSKYFKQSLSSLGLNSKAIFVLPNMAGVNCNQFISSSCETSEFKKNPASFSILFLSRFIKEKGVYELIKSIPLIPKQICSDIRFVFAGDGKEKSNMNQLCEDLEIKDNVHFPGYITGDHKIKTFQQADVFLLPTYFGEGIPLVLLEAMAAGLAIITTKAGGIPEIVEDGINGIILDEVSEEAIAEAIITLYDDPELAQEMGERNLKKARMEYDSSVVIKKIEDIYMQTVNH